MSYSNNYSWGTQNSNSNNKKQDAPLNVKNWQQLGAGNQVSRFVLFFLFFSCLQIFVVMFDF